MKRFRAFSLLLATTFLQSSAFAFTLDEKLDLQFEKYSEAQKVITDVVGRQGKTISRDDWEKLLALPQDESITQEDKESLTREQDAAVKEKAAEFKKMSKLNIDSLRTDATERARFCSEIPKGGMLHIHIGGTPHEDTVKKLLEHNNPSVDYKTVFDMVYAPHQFFFDHEIDFLPQTATTYKDMELESPRMASQFQRLFFFPPGNHGFDRFSGLFIINSFLKDAPTWAFYDQTVYDDFLARAQAEHVSYIEITTSYTLNDNFGKYFEGWTAEAKKYGIELRFNYSFNRAKKPEDNRALALALVKEPASPSVVGIDLLSDETSTPALEQGQTSYATVLAAVQDGKISLHRTMHAGELGDLRNVRDGLILGAERIGHGVQLIKDPVTLEYARRMHLPVEINLVSNVRLQSIDDIHHHPFLYYLRLGLRPSLSTDDEGMLDTDINKECRTAIANSDVSYAELKQMSENSIETSFAPDDLKRQLESKLNSDFASFEKKWTPELSK